MNTPIPAESNITDTDEALPLSHVVKRPKTSGEHLFDIGTYGGFALAANEFLSTWITGAIEKGAVKDIYEPFKKTFTTMPVLKKFDYVRSGRLPYILVSCIGGMLTVFPVKLMEDNKSSIVRWADRLLHGKNAETNPDLARAHTEMDEAPKQSWSSLWKGRLITVLSAIALDFTAGHPQALSTRLFEKTPLRNYSRVDRAGVTLSRKGADLLDPNGKQRRLLARDAAKPFAIQPGEGATVKWLGRGIFLLMLSLTLTVLFYCSSKLFATRREVHEEKKREEEGIAAANTVVFNAERAPAIQSGAVLNETIPDTKINTIAGRERIAGNEHSSGVPSAVGL